MNNSTDQHSLLLGLVETLRGHRSPASLTDLDLACRSAGLNGHLAVLNEPYLSRILAGCKQVESRFSRVRGAPYHCVNPNDVLLLKESSGPIRAIALVAEVEYHGPLSPGEAEELMETHKDRLALGESFAARKRSALYATLIRLGSVYPVPPLVINKRDRRAWVVLWTEQGRLL